MKRFALGIVFAVASLGAVASAQAQTTSTLTVVTACTVPGATQTQCLLALEAYIGLLQAQGLSPAQIDAAIGRLVVDLASAAPGASPVVAQALVTAASHVSEPGQANAILAVASDVGAGRNVTQSLNVVIVVASPN